MSPRADTTKQAGSIEDRTLPFYSHRQWIFMNIWWLLHCQLCLPQISDFAFYVVCTAAQHFRSRFPGRSLSTISLSLALTRNKRQWSMTQLNRKTVFRQHEPSSFPNLRGASVAWPALRSVLWNHLSKHLTNPPQDLEKKSKTLFYLLPILYPDILQLPVYSIN